MTGGLMNLNATGNENIILNGNPKKTFFRATYNKCTNFGLQKFRIDYKGQRTLDMSNPTILDFKIPRHADMLYETFICVTIPDIWSPLFFSEGKTYPLDNAANNYTNEQAANKMSFEENGTVFPYQFKWIRELGVRMIREIEIYSGGVTLTKYSGEYLILLH